MLTQKTLSEIESKLGYTFNDKHLLIQAFTRKSFSAEHPEWEDNEKLEFIGDKVLDFVVVKKLASTYGYQTTTKTNQFPFILDTNPISSVDSICEPKTKRNYEFAYDEGEMTELKKKLVQSDFLAFYIRHNSFEKYLLMSKGDVQNNVQNEPHVQEDLLEAIIGAIAIDSNWNLHVIDCVTTNFLNLDYHMQHFPEDMDYVSYIHNWHQKEYGREPDYDFWNINDGLFQCTLIFDGYTDGMFHGAGRSKKDAIKLAAKRAYTFLQEKKLLSKKIFDIIGNFTFDDAINKLQMLEDKKIINGLQYIFREESPTDESNGNPIWFCECIINGVNNSVEYGDAKKIKAKKACAFTMLQILTGKDEIMVRLKSDEGIGEPKWIT
jgi:ribonuclease-3